MPGSAQPWLLTSEKKDSATIAERTVRPPTQVIWLAPSTVPSSDSAQGASGCTAQDDRQQVINCDTPFIEQFPTLPATARRAPVAAQHTEDSMLMGEADMGSRHGLCASQGQGDRKPFGKLKQVLVRTVPGPSAMPSRRVCTQAFDLRCRVQYAPQACSDWRGSGGGAPWRRPQWAAPGPQLR